MKHLGCLGLVVIAFALAHEPAGGFVPDRTPLGEAPTSRKYYVNSVGMKFVWIPPGTFMMGSPKDELNRWNEMETLHKVTLTRGFFMGVHLVTQEQWQAVMGNNPSFFKGEKDLPVDMVSWDQCQIFAKTLQEKEKKLYRLPTDAEWEYSCRAGTKTPFHFGETLSSDQANFDGTKPYGNGKPGIKRDKTTPVGTFPANLWGLHDMHGNLWQWCQDIHGGFAEDAVIDPKAPARPTAGKVFRGGCYSNDASNCRAAARGAGIQNQGFHFVGVRFCFFAE